MRDTRLSTSAMRTSTLRRADYAAWITIDREKRGNSFRRQTLDEIIDALERAGDAADVRAVVITSAGGRFFSTGGDVGDYDRYTATT